MNSHYFPLVSLLLTILRNLGDVLTGQPPVFSPLLITGEFEWGFLLSILKDKFKLLRSMNAQKNCRLTAQAVAAYHNFSPFPTVYFLILPFPSIQERHG